MERIDALVKRVTEQEMTIAILRNHIERIERNCDEKIRNMQNEVVKWSDPIIKGYLQSAEYWLGHRIDEKLEGAKKELLRLVKNGEKVLKPGVTYAKKSRKKK